MLVKDFYKAFSQYKEFKDKFKKLFPSFYKGTLDIEIASWEEYRDLEKGDVDPDREGKSFSRKIMGVSFWDKRIVAFRNFPPEVPEPTIFLHELGHVHFKVSDVPWNATYGGAEVLFWLIYHEKVNVPNSDRSLAWYVEAFRTAHTGELRDKKRILSLILDIADEVLNLKPKTLAAFYHTCGTIKPDSFTDFQFEKLDAEVNYEREPFDVLMALLDGAKYDNPFLAPVLAKLLHTVSLS